jgi:hypothetical protein
MRGSLGAWAVSAQYENRGLELYCRLPRWSDACYFIEQEPQVMAVVLDAQSDPLRWLQYRGVARIIDSKDDRYVVLQIAPERIDLLDESQGWGARETLDL